ncbi:hypothetical protein B0T18DRAFT_179167 [Schizothecium vesticola]|uniref:Uncharacterized protein n=1 Tax=Schizothecium vesticola TaxID=314040 RepID=A0AA40EPQ7_9PEZI|nr:hypothetical protein B0T18DRAFT_179167 [Schizothecium vesticola]
MPPLKKSYSDQTRHQTNTRAQWKRTKSNPTANHPQALGPVSDSAQNKLQAFQFDPPPPKAPNDATDADPSEPNKKSASASASQNGENGPPGAPGAAVARTPAGRPTWQDLLGGKQTAKEEDVDSPSERIVWLNDAIEPSSAAMSPMLSRRGRKRRARSSSPVSSPAAKAPVTNLARGAPGQLTPSADPASELWDRFSVPGVAASPAARMNPLLARMLVSSSPRPPKGNDATGTERSFRKANSCGSNWPKRRKMERLDLDPAPVSQGGEASTNKSTLVSALLETVEGEIMKLDPESKVQGDNNSSPTLQKRRLSPRKSRAAGREPSILGTVVEGRPVPISSSPASTIDQLDLAKEEEPRNPSSDYGDDDFDDDFDDDTLMELDVNITTAPPPKIESTLVKDEEPAPAPPPALPPPALSKVFEDEFGDLDDADFADLDDDLFDGAEDLMAQVEVKSIAQPGLPGKQALHQEGEEDEYGDDFGDDLDLDAIEFAATQSAMQASGTSNVRSAW